MHNIDEFKELTGFYNIEQDLQYQKLMDAIKLHEEKELPQGIWASDDKIMPWDQIENIAWQLLKEKTRNFKLFTIWAQAYIKLYGLEYLNEIFLVLAKVLENDDFVANDTDYRQSIVRYIDKYLGNALNLVNINIGSYHTILLSEFENFSLENYIQFQELLANISQETELKLNIIYENAQKTFSELRKMLSDFGADNVVRLVKMMQLLNNLISYRAKMSEQEDIELAVDNKEKNIFYYKDAAYTSIMEGLQILERVDAQNLLIPFLHKAMRWKDMTLLQIFEDIGSAQEIEAFMKILKATKKQQIEY